MEETALWKCEKLETCKLRKSYFFGMSCFQEERKPQIQMSFALVSIFGSTFFFKTQVVDSKATVKRTTKPRRSSRNSMTVENGNELTSTMNGSRATSGRSASCGGQETRGWLSSLLFIRKT